MRAALHAGLSLLLLPTLLFAERLPVAGDAALLARLQIKAVAELPLIFKGEVASISRDGDAMIITFRVREAFRGAPAEDVIVLREWVGPWREDPQRVAAGQRGYFLLRSPTANGFGRMERCFALTREDQVLIEPPAGNLRRTSRRLRGRAHPITMRDEDFAAVLRQELRERK